MFFSPGCWLEAMEPLDLPLVVSHIVAGLPELHWMLLRLVAMVKPTGWASVISRVWQ